MSHVLDRTAQTDVPILDILAERWSTRVFDAETPIDEDALRAALEAARWSPSANNTQPWRFLLVRRGTDAHARVAESLVGFNQGWAPHAGALLVILAETADAEGNALPWATYDAGQSAAFFTVEAHARGLATHTMGGFSADDLRTAFDIDPRFTPVTVIAVGAFGDPDAADEAMRARESAPRTRRPLAETVLLDA